LYRYRTGTVFAQKEGFPVPVYFILSRVLDVLLKHGVITEERVRLVQEFISNNQTGGTGLKNAAGRLKDVLNLP